MADVDSRSFRILSLCSGVGGLELGLGLALRNARTVCYVEREAYAAEVLVTRMSEGHLDGAPVWTDLTTFDGKPWCGVVDCVTAGFPCQPVSVAGKRKAQDDERWIWPDIARIVREVGPAIVFLENVPGLLVRGMADVLGDLAEAGYDAEWGVFSAAGVGAPHLRRRVFILAHGGGAGLAIRSRESFKRGTIWQTGQAASSCRRELANADTARERGTELHVSGRRQDETVRHADGTGAEVAHAPPERSDGRGNPRSRGWRKYPDGNREPAPFPPPPGDTAAWEYVIGQWPELAPAVGMADTDTDGRRWKPRYSESPKETRRETPQPPVRGMADGPLHRVDRLRACGNGVVSTVAALAFLTLAERARLT